MVRGRAGTRTAPSLNTFDRRSKFQGPRACLLLGIRTTTSGAGSSVPSVRISLWLPISRLPPPTNREREIQSTSPGVPATRQPHRPARCRCRPSPFLDHLVEAVQLGWATTFFASRPGPLAWRTPADSTACLSRRKAVRGEGGSGVDCAGFILRRSKNGPGRRLTRGGPRIFFKSGQNSLFGRKVAGGEGGRKRAYSVYSIAQ